ncbi:proteasome regulatory particle base subunit [Schistosoma haematobium]|uniref:Proteasome regulatory particle base subunit n=1 Tax=Schistosoma haematobium TaxID=6185 RepID=A0A922IHW3_SCHHA|nr:proteasome regulatory particle base subunit [Schistosoma haematobium]KAH9579457.1 proteasome regulatory particle base subunit [Schistosoma haematobium]
MLLFSLSVALVPLPKSLLNRTWSMFAVACISDFSASDSILLGPAAFPLLIFLMAILFSSVVGGVTSIGKFVGAASISGGFNGVGLFKSFFQPLSRSHIRTPFHHPSHFC